MKQSSLRKEFRSFKDSEFYNDSNGNFSLLPFNFRRLDSGKELLINFLGDFIIAPKGTVQKITKKDPSILDEDLYLELISNNFIHESEEIKNIELLANRYRN